MNIPSEQMIEAIKRLPNTLVGVIGAHNDSAIIELLGKTSVIDSFETDKTLNLHSIGIVALGAVMPEQLDVSIELEEPEHLAVVQKISARQSPDWRQSASLISSAVKIEKEHEGNIAVGEEWIIRIPGRSFTGALMDLPSRVTLARAQGDDSLLVTIDGLNNEGTAEKALVARDLHSPYYSGGWSDALFVDGDEIRQAAIPGRAYQRAEALNMILKDATQKL